MAVQVEAEMMAHIAAAEKKSNILERQLNQVSDYAVTFTVSAQVLGEAVLSAVSNSNIGSRLAGD